MKWLTLTKIGRRARSKKGALKVSYEIWNQRYQATAKETRQILKEGKIELGCDYCGLCRYYHAGVGCDKCPLGKSDMRCYNGFSIYFRARVALDKWRKQPTSSNWWAWKKASKALRDKLKELMESV